MAAAPLAGPYRQPGVLAAALRPAGVPAPRSLEESWIGDGVTLSLDGELRAPKLWPLHIAMAVVTFGPPVGVGIGLLFGADPIALVPAILFGGFFGWVWHRSLLGHRVAMLANEGRIDDAERLMGRKAFGMHLTIGLIAQMRGDHERAAGAYRATVAPFDHRPHHRQPVHSQAYPREAIALVNLRRFDEASRRLQATPAAGPYVHALVMVAQAYLAFATGSALPPVFVEQLERRFLPVRGSWGALALAAWFRDRAGDAAGCTALLDQERQRANAHHLAGFMPLLAQWAEQRRATQGHALR